jgi:glucuronate isomerase
MGGLALHCSHLLNPAFHVSVIPTFRFDKVVEVYSILWPGNYGFVDSVSRSMRTRGAGIRSEVTKTDFP